MEEQVKKENLNDAEAALLLAQTLEFNGLPLLQSPSKIGLPSQEEESSFLPPLPTFLEDILSPGPGFQTVNRLGEAAATVEEDNGLPTPGTLEHAVTLGLFKIQQGINRFARNPQSLLTEVGAVLFQWDIGMYGSY